MNKIEGLQGKRIIQHVVVTLLILQTIFIENFVACQRRSSNKRSDVYIAGFFPFADGVENSQTGKAFLFHGYSYGVTSFSVHVKEKAHERAF